MGQACIPKRIVETGIYREPIARAWYVIKTERINIYDEGLLKDVANKSETWKNVFVRMLRSRKELRAAYYVYVIDSLSNNSRTFPIFVTMKCESRAAAVLLSRREGTGEGDALTWFHEDHGHGHLEGVKVA